MIGATSPGAAPPQLDAAAPRPLGRSPVFVLRALVGCTVFAVGVVGLVVFEQALLGLSADVAAIQAEWPDPFLTSIEVSLLIAFAIGVVGTNLVLLANRMYRRLVLVNASAVAALLLGAVAGHLVLAVAPSNAIEVALDEASRSSLGNDALATVVAVSTIATVWIGERERPWLVGMVVVAVGISLIGGSTSVITLPFDVGVGLFAGASVALVLRTRDRTPTASQVASALAGAGVDATSVSRAQVDARGSIPWFVRATGGKELFVKTLDGDHRSADLLFRLYRAVRLRRPGDHRPFASLRRAAEHEAFMSLLAEAGGVRTPRLVSVSGIGMDGMMLAYERISGRSLDAAKADDLTDPVLSRIWERVVELHNSGIAHRDLRLANVFLADDGEIWLIDFGFGEVAVEGPAPARDVAELLASTATVVGPERAVGAAVDVIGGRSVAAAIPWVQPLALSSATRARLDGRDACAELRAVAATSTGVRDTDIERVARSGPWSIVSSALGTRRRRRDET